MTIIKRLTPKILPVDSLIERKSPSTPSLVPCYIARKWRTFQNLAGCGNFETSETEVLSAILAERGDIAKTAKKIVQEAERVLARGEGTKAFQNAITDLTAHIYDGDWIDSAKLERELTRNMLTSQYTHTLAVGQLITPTANSLLIRLRGLFPKDLGLTCIDNNKTFLHCDHIENILKARINERSSEDKQKAQILLHQLLKHKTAENIFSRMEIVPTPPGTPAEHNLIAVRAGTPEERISSDGTESVGSN